MQTLKIKIQLYCGDEIAIGPGKAALLDEIGRSGSISGAARAMGMSYRRAWLLVDTMNRCFKSPLVETHPGGGKASGARLSQTGQAILAAYWQMAAQMRNHASGAGLDQISGALRASPQTG